MNRRDFPSEAAYLRAHREAFCLAMELGCTPKEAEIKLRRERAAAAKQAARSLAADIKPDPSDRWMMRD